MLISIKENQVYAFVREFDEPITVVCIHCGLDSRCGSIVAQVFLDGKSYTIVDTSKARCHYCDQLMCLPRFFVSTAFAQRALADIMYAVHNGGLDLANLQVWPLPFIHCDTISVDFPPQRPTHP